MRGLQKAWNSKPEGGYRRRTGIILAAALSLSSPFLIWRAYEIKLIFARVPEPLQSHWIDYRVEKSWGIGGPGDNETGFVVYRLRSSSAEWARSQGATLDLSLNSKEGVWLPTPVDDLSPERGWHDAFDDRNKPVHQADFAEYLNRYGFGISIDKDWLARANHAARTSGSFYRYGRGGRVTVIDPSAGKVYFAYAG